MDTVIVTISRANLLSDMRLKSHGEVSVIADPKARYLAELGSEKTEEAHQCITDAANEVHAALRRLLTGFDDTLSATDDYDTAEITFALEVTGRKSPGMADALAKAVHAYIVDSALSKFYESVSRQDLADKHKGRLPAALSVITTIAYSKSNPTYE